MEPEAIEFWEHVFRADQCLRALQSKALQCGDMDRIVAFAEASGSMGVLLQFAEKLRCNRVVEHRGRRAAARRDAVAELEALADSGGAIEKCEGPLFFQEGDKLVKIELQGKRGGAYRHSCDLARLLQIAQIIDRLGSTTKPVKFSTIKEALDPSATNHQIYAALDWLRESGLIKRLGKEGYIAVLAGDFAGEIKARFERLPEWDMSRRRYGLAR